eukprot:TRINITY_DN403_c1_g1_i1.p1 TRINITY_DN403_c1_g1~~TRINITY_DN403_c1_g1_i1.p1  ORF type:complete len:116 (-),score=38.77 TRINITY_DN403_c1_g1_i1:42-389(-)
MEYLYHIVLESDWYEIQLRKFYEPESLATVNFIHLSTEKQIEGTLKRFFIDKNVVILKIEVSKLTSTLKWDPVEHEEDGQIKQYLFPHLYGPLNLESLHSIKKAQISQTAEINYN